uniref:Uncharacterized protein n=1 Tax=Physcomitrium patens TaxID=3218 RepID=A0A2K1JBA3_PHYPA|nr:hypothetical protein PHYPA_019101 [Physcomitrium patens]
MRNLGAQWLGWADQWDYKYNDKYGSENSSNTKSSSNKEKLAKVKSAASAGVDKTKSTVSSGAQKMARWPRVGSGGSWTRSRRSPNRYPLHRASPPGCSIFQVHIRSFMAVAWER